MESIYRRNQNTKQIGLDLIDKESNEKWEEVQAL